NGHIRPTWKLVDGVCRESLAFETAEKEGIPETVIRRAEELYFSVNTRDSRADTVDHKYHLKGLGEEWDSLKTSAAPSSFGTMKVLHKEVENAVTIICQKKLIELYKKKSIPEIVEVLCVAIGVREQPPPSTVGTSSIYVHFRPD
ncbi:hypothetical protein, partial [Nostoc sp. CALU 1950]|uniref:hypothetical protein n=1 Tax=Nostoc sp. CALU 1950 TaxID=3104321 RepID=UPI003EB83F32